MSLGLCLCRISFNPFKPVRVRVRVRVRVTLRLAVYRQLSRHDQEIFRMITCFHSPYVTSSLTRGWVCNLQLLLALASRVILRSDSRGTRNHILLSQIRDSPNWRTRSPYLYKYTPGTEWPTCIPSHCVSFSSPPTTRRATHNLHYKNQSVNVLLINM
jgi:hypothetical protein